VVGTAVVVLVVGAAVVVVVVMQEDPANMLLAVAGVSTESTKI
jgi:hypothetical protein